MAALIGGRDLSRKVSAFGSNDKAKYVKPRQKSLLAAAVCMLNVVVRLYRRWTEWYVSPLPGLSVRLGEGSVHHAQRATAFGSRWT